MTEKPTQDIKSSQSTRKSLTIYGRPLPIIIICASLCIAWTIMLANNFSILVNSIAHFFGPYSAEIVLNLLFLACSIFFIWKLKIAGHILVTIWCIINLAGNFLTLKLALEMYGNNSFSPFPDAHPAEFILPIVLLFGLLYYINKKSVRLLFYK